MSFGGIAIVGRACVLPGALSPQDLWRAVLAGRDLTSSTPAGRWRVEPSRVLCSYADGDSTSDRAFCDRGGYVTGFDGVFDPSGFAIGKDEIAGLDPLFQWVLHAGREALRDGGLVGDAGRVGAVFGNLSYPSSSLSRFAESVWLENEGKSSDGLPRVAAKNRFMSGLPAHTLARGLGLGAGAFALDAACASSLYAIKLACDRLHDGKADWMLAGAVNAADDLFLHVGFTALNALSPSGVSRPFDAGADGLLPAEGAAFVALRRLEDAVRDKNRILGVIRGVGLSNDGRGRGLLVPSEQGQVRAMRAAYAEAGLAPSDVSLLECHATGTIVGDSAEVRSMAEVFAGTREIPIGSLKANLGHLITVAGVAGLLKVLGALEAGVRPPTPNLRDPNPALAGTPFRVLREAEAWDSKGPRRAAVSAFGFGGNNAHLVVEAWGSGAGAVTALRGTPSQDTAKSAAASSEVAIVAMGARVADGQSVQDFADAIAARKSRVRGSPPSGHADEVVLSLKELRFPPQDLKDAVAQQTLIFAAVREALAACPSLPRERTSILIGMQCDAEIARHGARWRMGEWAQRWGADEAWAAGAREGFVPLLGAAGVLGAMPNIVANRLNSQFDVLGPSFAVSSEELSGVRALEIARRALVSREIDAAIVGAVDLSAEPVHRAAAREVLPAGSQTSGDAAVALVLKRLDDARRDGDRVLAILTDEPATPSSRRWGPGEGSPDLHALFGHAHAASGLVEVAAAALACHHRWGAGPTVEVRVSALEGQHATVWLREDPETPSDGARANPPEPPCATFVAHPPQPHLPLLAARALGTHQMHPAPSLPPVLEPALPSVDLVREVAAPAVSIEVGPGLDRVAQRRLLQQRQIAQIHEQFVAQQSAVHQQFLQVRSRAIETLMRAASGAVQAPAAVHAPAAKPELSFTRADLEVHASGTISKIFGPLFEQQDRFVVQVRMPEPPLLLADRVTAIRAEPGTMGLGTVWTETDVREDSWYLNAGYMPAGVMIEAGQADLFLISYLGVDFLNKGERAYRLLGCELTYHRGLPKPGETLRYEITIDSHAEHGDVRLFFFHYECTIDGVPVLTVRNGQAGFFTRKDLNESAGVLWSPEDQAISKDARLDPPAVACKRTDFSASQVRAFAGGDLFGCFGEGFELGQTHTRTPSIQSGDMLFLDRVAGFDPRGGPWGRGYMRATTDIRPDKWFFQGHFKNDPCMPGTLMFEGCLQMMAFFVAGLGYTIEKDGWRFEPVMDEPSTLHCRGQVLPGSKELVCEIFVEEVLSGPTPTIYADLLGTVDGLKAFHARRMGLRLVPDWPLTSRPALAKTVDTKPVASRDGFEFGYASLLACALGKPSDAFGPMYQVFDGHRRVARLPSPPYHFMTRVLRVDGAIGVMEPGASVEIEYDIPRDAWFFEETGSKSMPFSILLEAALQPCGWLASYVGSAITTEEDLCFRNLDGKGTVLREIFPDAGTLRTVATLKSVSQSGTMILENFDVECFLGEERVCHLTTGFGFFPPEALQNQIGLPTTPVERQRIDAPGDLLVDLTTSPARYCTGSARLPDPMLRMLDRVTAFVPDGGDAKLGFLRAEKDVNPAEWFFKAHFFQDPVQPGSLGVQAMLQLLQFYMLHTGMDRGFEEPIFEAIATEREAVWKYRGQVVPSNKRIRTTAQIVETGRDARGAYVLADASLWVDEKQIYRCATIGMRIVEGKAPRFDIEPIRDYWRTELGVRAWPGEDVYRALVTSFVRRARFADEAALRSLGPRGVLYLANHQVAVESTGFALVASALSRSPIVALAKVENRRHWLELVMEHTFAYPGVGLSGMVVHFDRQESESLPGIIENLLASMRDANRSVLVHVEGTRSLECRSKVAKMSGTFIDMAIAAERPIVPVRFVGGLPSAALETRLEFPYGMAKQDYYFGAPILPSKLASLSYKARIELVVSAINGLGPPNEIEEPHAGDPALEASVQSWMRDTGAEYGPATLFRLLEALADPCDDVRDLVRGARAGEARFPDTIKGRWVAELARMLFGSRGPRVVVG